MPQREMFPHFGQALFVGLALPPVSDRRIEDDPQRDAGEYSPHLIRSPTDHRVRRFTCKRKGRRHSRAAAAGLKIIRLMNCTSPGNPENSARPLKCES
jgi:hypothetical protein